MSSWAPLATWGPVALGLALLVPARAWSEPRHRPADELGTPLPAAGRVAPPPPRTMPRGAGLVPVAEQDRVHGLGLVRRSDGTFGYQDPGHRFSALVRRDGSVLFANRWRRFDHRQHLSGRGLALPTEGARAMNPFVGLRLRGPNEWALGISGSDPAAASKAGFLARTGSFRHNLAVGFARLQFREGLRALPGQLLTIWSDRSRSPSVRRRLLFQRWDDSAEALAQPTLIAEPASDEAAVSIDLERARTAQAAREMIEAFVRRHLGAQHPHAYSAQELRRLNSTRKSLLPFDPYQATPP